MSLSVFSLYFCLWLLSFTEPYLYTRNPGNREGQEPVGEGCRTSGERIREGIGVVGLVYWMVTVAES